MHFSNKYYFLEESLMNMKAWLEELRLAPKKKAMPVLSFPCIQLLDISVKELIASGEMQAKGMKLVADRIPSAAAVPIIVAMRADKTAKISVFLSASKVSGELNSSIYHLKLKPSNTAVLFAELNEKKIRVTIGI